MKTRAQTKAVKTETSSNAAEGDQNDKNKFKVKKGKKSESKKSKDKPKPRPGITIHLISSGDEEQAEDKIKKNDDSDKLIEMFKKITSAHSNLLQEHVEVNKTCHTLDAMIPKMKLDAKTVEALEVLESLIIKTRLSELV